MRDVLAGQISSRASSIAAGQRSSSMQKLFLRLTTTSLETLGDRHNPSSLLDTVKRTNQLWTCRSEVVWNGVFGA